MRKADIIYAFEEQAGRRFVDGVWGKVPTYTVVIGNTETAKVPGVSAAGAEVLLAHAASDSVIAQTSRAISIFLINS